MDYRWFKFYGQDWLTDVKVMRLSDQDRLCYLSLLCLASMSSDQGKIYDYDEDALLMITRLGNEQEATGCLNRFVEKGMISIDKNGVITVNAFVKRQNSNLTVNERVKKHRENKKRVSNVTPSVTTDVTDVTLEKRRLEKKREEKKNASASVEYLANIPENDLAEFSYRFDASPEQIKNKAESLKLYCEAKGKRYANYKAFLLNAIKKDFRELNEKDQEQRKITQERVKATMEKIGQSPPSAVEESPPPDFDFVGSRNALLGKMSLNK